MPYGIRYALFLQCVFHPIYFFAFVHDFLVRIDLPVYFSLSLSPSLSALLFNFFIKFHNYFLLRFCLFFSFRILFLTCFKCRPSWHSFALFVYSVAFGLFLVRWRLTQIEIEKMKKKIIANERRWRISLCFDFFVFICYVIVFSISRWFVCTSCVYSFYLITNVMTRLSWWRCDAWVAHRISNSHLAHARLRPSQCSFIRKCVCVNVFVMPRCTCSDCLFFFYIFREFFSFVDSFVSSSQRTAMHNNKQTHSHGSPISLDFSFIRIYLDGKGPFNGRLQEEIRRTLTNFHSHKM